ncbi:uridine kinase-like protein 1, chloroplastic isoform X1 [Glycine max]|uniref:uridine kinase-like protein 1, chloroplastic isoform X1 n=1 Tax=Glycine max TaxID=3847 RepID=UPI001B355817|nr:uridine kinase-like protein 1, chloroplastic isoform X1 [Glycine max]
MDMVIEVLSGAHFSGWHPSTTSSCSSPTSSHHPFVIGVSGGTASGKTTVCDLIIQQLQDHRVVLVSQDSFYRGLTNDELKRVHEYNFDHPNAFDTEQLVETLSKLKSGQSVQVPFYDFKLHQRSSERSRQVNASEVIILEGILVFHEQRVRNMMNMKIFVDADPDVRLARRIRRDTVERGRDVHSVLEQYAKFVKPAFDDFILPSKKYADIIIPRGGDNLVAIDLIVQHIRTKLGQHNLCKIYPNVNVIQSTFQTRGMHTLIRDRDLSKHDFVFYSDRLIRVVVEHGLGYLPFTEKQVITPTGSIYTGVDFCKKLCGVSIIRSGESMENALRACCKGIKIGKILIHREGGDETQLIYEKLPKDISERHVLLMDPVLGTGELSFLHPCFLNTHQFSQSHSSCQITLPIKPILFSLLSISILVSMNNLHVLLLFITAKIVGDWYLPDRITEQNFSFTLDSQPRKLRPPNSSFTFFFLFIYA